MTFPRMFSLAGRRALVTGGASGIGQAMAAALADAGADVAVTVHSRPADLTRALVESAGRAFAEVRCDLTDPDVAEQVLDDAEHALGPLDILVNNAGLIRRADALGTGEADWRAVLSVNLDATWRLAQAGARRMVARGDGKIVNIASLLAFQGGVRVPAYAASKHAVVGLTKALANELAPLNVNVNALAPGYIRTANTAPLREDAVRSAQILDRIPAGRWGDPDDVAGACVFLCSPAADYVHGHVLAVDGGWLAR